MPRLTRPSCAGRIVSLLTLLALTLNLPISLAMAATPQKTAGSRWKNVESLVANVTLNQRVLVVYTANEPKSFDVANY